MSNIVTQKVQFGKRLEAVYRCYCGENSFLVLVKAWEDEDESQEYYVSISHYTTSFKHRLKDAWRALRGYENTVTGEVLLTQEQLEDLARDINKLTGADEAWMENARAKDTCCVLGCPGKNFPYCVTHDV